MSCGRWSRVSDVIPYGRQWIDDEDIEAVARVLRSDFLTTGPAVPQFEQELTKETGARHAVALNSGTSALHAMYFATGIGPGDEIITSPMTFAATANAALYLGAAVRFADIDPETGNIDADRVEEQVTERTKAIVAVDYTGAPADYDRLRAIADRHGLALLADAAHSLGARYRGRPVGTLADASALSFHPVKPITTGEGGAVVTDDDGIAARVTRFRTHGITRDRDELSRSDGPWYYEQVDLGFNYRLTDIQAALGSSQLRRLDHFIARRREIAARYGNELAGVNAIELPVAPAAIDPGWHLYVVRVHDAARRLAFYEGLRDRGLNVQVHYIPVYWHPYYRSLGFERGQCTVAEDWYRRAVSLPIFAALDDRALSSVIAAVHETAATL
jgi:perosamine synthetase